MKIITVSGAHSNIGKTTVIERLLKIFKGWSCLKVTVLHNGLCPTGRDCGVCSKMSSRFSIVSDKEIIEKPGKDTWRFKKAGAKKVLWLKAKPSGLKQGLKKVISMFSAAGGSLPVRQAGAYGGKDTCGLIIEGTSVLRYLKPDLAIFVQRKNSIFPPTLRRGIPPNILGEMREKPSAKEVLKKVDLILTL